MKYLDINPHVLYQLSLNAFFQTIPECDVDIDEGSRHMTFKMRNVAVELNKQPRKRHTIVALIMRTASQSEQEKFYTWLNDYFTEEAQSTHFGFSIDPETKEKRFTNKELSRMLKKN